MAESYKTDATRKDSISNDQSCPTRKQYTREPYLPQTLFSSRPL